MTDGYIKKKDAENVLGNTCIEWEILKKIEAIPDAEVREIKRGHWIKMPMACYGGGTTTEYRCSQCEENQIIKSKFCPECGAEMSEVTT